MCRILNVDPCALFLNCVVAQSSPKPETKTELMKSCVALYKELLLLENFAVMNFCGISKVMDGEHSLVHFLSACRAVTNQDAMQLHIDFEEARQVDRVCNAP